MKGEEYDESLRELAAWFVMDRTEEDMRAMDSSTSTLLHEDGSELEWGYAFSS